LNNQIKTIVHDKNTEILQKIVQLEFNANLLKRLRKIENTLLNMGAYSTHNMELQNKIFDNLNVPQWEKDIINNSKAVKTTIAHKLLKEYDMIMKELKGD
jgi:hypothetical protein